MEEFQFGRSLSTSAELISSLTARLLNPLRRLRRLLGVQCGEISCLAFRNVGVSFNYGISSHKTSTLNH